MPLSRKASRQLMVAIDAGDLEDNGPHAPLQGRRRQDLLRARERKQTFAAVDYVVVVS
jgi:hypothetical protein